MSAYAAAIAGEQHPSEGGWGKICARTWVAVLLGGAERLHAACTRKGKGNYTVCLQVAVCAPRCLGAPSKLAQVSLNQLLLKRAANLAICCLSAADLAI